MDRRELLGYERFKDQAQIHKARAENLERELHVLGPALYRADQKLDRLDQRNEVADTLGQTCCPQCRSQLSNVKRHERLVEERVPSEVVTTCYHTTSGWCSSCRKTLY